MAGRKLRPNRASAWLTKRFQAHGAQMALARDSGVDQPLLSRLARGASPGFATATKLKRWIPFAWWTQPAPDSEPPPDVDDEQTTPLLERPPLGEAANEDRDSVPESGSPLEPKYPPSTPPPPPSEEEERASQRPRTGSSDPFGYA